MTTAFEYKLEILKQELEYTNSTIRKMDDIMKNVKNWAIIVWGVGLGTAIASDSLKNSVWLTALFPLLFWFVDALFRRIQRCFIYRLDQISDFLNSEQFIQSFEQQTLVGFTLLDPMAKKSRGADYKSFVSMRRIMCWPTTCALYVGMAVMSFVVHLIVN